MYTKIIIVTFSLFPRKKSKASIFSKKISKAYIFSKKITPKKFDSIKMAKKKLHVKKFLEKIKKITASNLLVIQSHLKKVLFISF